MKILYNAVILTKKHTGYATVIRNYLKQISKKNLDIEFIVPVQKSAYEEHLKDIKSENIKYIIINDMDLKKRVVYEQFFLNKLAKKYDVDIIHCPATLGIVNPVRSQLIFFHASTTFMLPRDMHGRSFLATALINWIIKKSTLNPKTIVATTTDTTAKELINFIKKDIKTYTIYNGIPDIDKNIDIKKIREDIKNLKNKKILLYVSSFYKLKNQEILIKLSEYINDEFVIVLAGNPVQENYFNYCVDLAKNRKNVKIFPSVNFEELKYLYNSSYIYITPSKFEGFALTPLEASQFEKPILLADIPVLREVYSDEFLYFNPDDVFDLKEKIEFIDKNYHNYMEKSLNAAKNLFAKYSWENFMQKNLDLYQMIKNG